MKTVFLYSVLVVVILLNNTGCGKEKMKYQMVVN